MATGRGRIGWLGFLLLAIAVSGVAVLGLQRARSRGAERAAFPQHEGRLSVAGV